MSNPDTQSANAPAKKGRSKLLTIGIPAVVLLLGGAGAGFWYVQNVRAAAASDKKPEEKEPTGLLTLDAFTVNLADPGGRRFLRISIKLVLPDAETAKKVGEEELAMSKVRSALLDVLSAQMAVEISTAEGREKLKHAIAETASHTGHMDVRDVLFQDFVVQ
jgi:flagellar FliL protein